jgi:mannose-6-phosphate isomerase-like protein (cupin superfamily)
MVKRQGEYRKVYEPNLKGGDGIIEIENFFEPEDFHGIGRLYGISIIRPGDSIGWHQHIGEQEAYFILEGEALYNDNGEETILRPGDYAICRDGEFHAIKCHGEKTLKYIAFIMFTNKN